MSIQVHVTTYQEISPSDYLGNANIAGLKFQELLSSEGRQARQCKFVLIIELHIKKKSLVCLKRPYVHMADLREQPHLIRTLASERGTYSLSKPLGSFSFIWSLKSKSLERHCHSESIFLKEEAVCYKGVGQCRF